jgi:glycerate-2-kinase
MTIKNHSELAVSPLREKALQIIDAGIGAIDPEKVLTEKVSIKGDILSVGKKKFDLGSFRNIFVVGTGKASFRAAATLEKIMGNKITDGAVIDVSAGKLKRIRSYEGTHPFPSEANVKATEEIIKILQRAKKNDLVIAIISGGGSSLLCQPNKMTCISLGQITETLFRKGADIKEMNILRKHMSKIHGGNLARLAYPATVVSLIFSDIPFSDLSMVASGPTYPDKTTKKDAEKVMAKYGLPKIPLIETPKALKYFDKVSNILILNNKIALKAMKKKADELGFRSRVCATCLRGEAKAVGREMAELLNKEGKGSALIAGGETTVIVKKKGKGGRNLEVVLGALNHIKEGQLIISISSDGKDHIKEAAGAIGDAILKKRMVEVGYDPDFFLEENRSYAFFRDLHGIIVTGKTGSNVSDLLLALWE